MHYSGEIYQIKIQGPFQQRFSKLLSSFEIEDGLNGITILTGPIIDQAALRGILDMFFDLGISILSIQKLESQY